MIKIKTQEQLVELAARSIYLLSNLRSWQKEFEETRAIKSLCKDEDIILWEIRIDEFLKNIECTEFEPLKVLIAQLKIEINDTTTKV